MFFFSFHFEWKSQVHCMFKKCMKKCKPVNGLHASMCIARVKVKSNLHGCIALWALKCCLLVLYSKSVTGSKKPLYFVCFLTVSLCICGFLKKIMCNVQDTCMSVVFVQFNLKAIIIEKRKIGFVRVWIFLALFKVHYFDKWKFSILFYDFMFCFVKAIIIPW